MAPRRQSPTSPAFAGMAPDSPQRSCSAVFCCEPRRRVTTAGTRRVIRSGDRGQRTPPCRREPYRQPFGREYTRRYGRPVGWLLVAGAIEKIFFPVALLHHAPAAALGGAAGYDRRARALIALTALVLVTKGQRLQYFFKGLAVIPLRYALIAAELVTLGRFAADLWITKNRNWRK